MCPFFVTQLRVLPSLLPHLLERVGQLHVADLLRILELQEPVPAVTYHEKPRSCYSNGSPFVLFLR